jgi:hypothetical protein
MKIKQIFKKKINITNPIKFKKTYLIWKINIKVVLNWYDLHFFLSLKI